MIDPKLRRLFIVEDQRLIAADLESTLKRLGYQVVGNVPSGEEASERAPPLRPDLVLMDIRLQGKLDGIQAAAAIRQSIDVPIVYLTAYADEDTIARAKVTGPFGYVVKPFNERELRAAIEIALYKHDTDLLLTQEKAARVAAEEFRILVEAVQDYAIIRLSPQGRILSWNAGAQRIHGYHPQEAIGRPVSTLYPAAEQEAGKPEAALDRATSQGRAEEEGWRLRQDTSCFWANDLLTPLRDEGGQLVGFAQVTRDLTERRQREESQAFLDRSTLALASSLDITDTLQRAMRLAVTGLADWCLFDLADERGQLVQTAVAHSDPDKESLARKLSRQLSTDRGLSHGPHHVFRTGQSELYPELPDVEWAAELLTTDHPELLRELGVRSYICVPIRFRGRNQGVLSLMRAGPPRRYTRVDLALAEEFARRAGMAIDNARLYREAQEAIRYRDEFLQVASHELKTPLTPLQMQLDTLSLALQTAGAENQRLFGKVEMATRQTVRLGRLVESLLDVTRITGGRLELLLEEFDLCLMVQEVVERLRGEGQRVGSELIFNPTTPRVMGHWDRMKLEQVVTNLVSNAVKYGAGKRVEVEVRESDGTVRLSVTDHGIGIASEDLGRIFNRFERAVSLRHYGGLGLGLYITRNIVEAHGGTVLVKSQPGEGSCFNVVLPLRAAELKAGTQAPQPGTGL